MTLTSAQAALELDEALAATHEQLWQRLGDCGTWWTGAERVQAMSEARQALECDLCRERSEALTPMMVSGEHDSVSNLSAEASDLVHRLSTDPGRLSKEWASKVIESITEEAYVELATVVCVQYVIDSFNRCLDLPLRD